MISFFTNAIAEDRDGSVTGLVIDKSNNEIVSSAMVYIDNGSVSKLVYTDLAGKYHFEKLPPGWYKLVVKRIGYEESAREIEIEPGKTLQFNIYIKGAELEIESINVTATKTELTLQKTPSSISVINSEDVKNRSVITFDQVLQNVQSVSINRTSGINVSSLSIRGSSDVAGGGIGNRVLLLLDGRPSLTGDSKGALWSLIPVSVIERTEVVKGAFSSLYGSSAIGGVINIITKRPTYKPYFLVNINGGFYEKLAKQYQYTDALLTYKGIDILHSNTLSKFSYLVDFNYKQNDGYAQQTEYNFFSGIAKLTYDLISNRDLEFTFQYTNSQSGYPHYWRVDQGSMPSYWQVSPTLLGDKIYKESQSYDLQYRAVPNSHAKYNTRFYYYKLDSRSEYNPNNFVSRQYGTPGEVYKTFITSHNFGNISQADFVLGDKNYFIAGLDLQWNIVKSSPAEVLYGNQQQNNIGIFAQDQIKFITDDNNDPVFSSTIAGRIDFNQFVGSNSTTQLSPKISFVYSPVVNKGIFNNTHFRILAGRAFRSPSIAELYFKKELFGGFDFVYNPNLKPEEMVSAEIGIRKQYKNRFNIDISAFINLYDNLIQYVNIGGAINGPFQVQNIAKAQIKGLEFSMDYSHYFLLAHKQFDYSLAIGYSYIDAVDLSPSRQDDFLPYKPKHLFNFAINLNYEGFNFNTTGRYVAKIDEVIFFKFEEPKAYFILDAKISKTIGNNFSIYFSANNIFNEFYQELERIPAPNRNFNAGFIVEFK